MDTPIQRIALITGSSRGLGLAIARGLGRKGLGVVVTGRTEQAAEASAEQLRADGVAEVMAHSLEVTDPASVFRIFAEIDRRYGRLDVLVNNAGVAVDRDRRPSVPDFEQIEVTLDTNLKGAWRCSAQAVALMRRGGYGRIVNISTSMASLAVMKANSPAYRVSKAALNALTRVFADDTANDGILVNSVSPGVVDTRMSYGGELQSPDEAAENLMWLATLPDNGPNGAFFMGSEKLPW